MGQKIHPVGFRIGVIRDWESRWFADKEFAAFVLEDAKIRRHIKKNLNAAGISRVEIERAAQKLRITLHTAKPGIIIGRGGKGADDLRAFIERMTHKQVHINVQEVREPELDGQLVAESIAQQIEKRVAYRRAMRQAVTRTMRVGAKGIKVRCGGRLAGAEIARVEVDKQGKIPLHTLRADIDYGFAEAATTYGNIGIKVWIYKGDILPGARRAEPTDEEIFARRRESRMERPDRGERRPGGPGGRPGGGGRFGGGRPGGPGGPGGRPGGGGRFGGGRPGGPGGGGGGPRGGRR
ncbi:MAG: 30S ribosomal protein S3 [Armatimonadota bacterium]|nr:30S ribosomal protein S3 [Armatimonadota bacterium]